MQRPNELKQPTRLDALGDAVKAAAQGEEKPQPNRHERRKLAAFERRSKKKRKR